MVCKDAPEVQAAFRHGLDADFPFLSDATLGLTDALGIRESTDTQHGPLPVPMTFALRADFTVHRVWSGWWFSGLPTPEELRQTVRELLRLAQPDFDFTGDG